MAANRTTSRHSTSCPLLRRAMPVTARGKNPPPLPRGRARERTARAPDGWAVRCVKGPILGTADRFAWKRELNYYQGQVVHFVALSFVRAIRGCSRAKSFVHANIIECHAATPRVRATARRAAATPGSSSFVRRSNRRESSPRRLTDRVCVCVVVLAGVAGRRRWTVFDRVVLERGVFSRRCRTRSSARARSRSVETTRVTRKEFVSSPTTTRITVTHVLLSARAPPRALWRPPLVLRARGAARARRARAAAAARAARVARRRRAAARPEGLQLRRLLPT